MFSSPDVSEEIGQALSRAAVMKSLDTAFATVAAQSEYCDNTKSIVPGSSNKKLKGDAVIQLLQDMVEDKSIKTEKFFSEQLRGKSIILENVKSQTDATKFMKKDKR